MVDHTGEEQAIELPLSKTIVPDTVYDLQSSNIPARAVIVFNDALCAVIGYRHECTTGIYRHYNLDGMILSFAPYGRGEEEPAASLSHYAA